jgi:hypothetical protein
MPAWAVIPKEAVVGRNKRSAVTAWFGILP